MDGTPKLETPPRMLTFKGHVDIKLIGGKEITHHYTIKAPDEMNAGKALADMIGNIGQRGIMSYNAQLEEFQLYPAPGQIRSIRAKLPKIVIAQ